jgi:hypothetical protein
LETAESGIRVVNLLEVGADCNARDNMDLTPLMIAVDTNHHEFSERAVPGFAALLAHPDVRVLCCAVWPLTGLVQLCCGCAVAVAVAVQRLCCVVARLARELRVDAVVVSARHQIDLDIEGQMSDSLSSLGVSCTLELLDEEGTLQRVRGRAHLELQRTLCPGRPVW